MYLQKILLVLAFPFSILFSQTQSTDIEKETWGYKITDEGVAKDVFNEVVCTSSPIETSGSWKFSFDFSIYSPENYGNLFLLKDDEKNYSISAMYLHYLNADTGYINFYINNIKTDIVIPLIKKNLNSTNWDKLTLEYTPNENSLIVYLNNKLIKSILHTPPQNPTLKLIFSVKELEVARFIVRDVKWFNRNTLSHNWKFNEREGSVVYDEISSNNGIALMGEWFNNISESFKVEWSFSSTEIHNNPHPILLDKDAGLFYFIEGSKIAEYNTNTNRDSIIFTKNNLPTKQITPVKFKNNLAIFHSGAEGEVSFYDSYTQSWSPINAKGDFEQHYYLSGLFVDNNKIYSVGGYGWHRWKNSIRYYDINTRKWITLNIKTPYNFYPRAVDHVEPGIAEHEWLISGLCGEGYPTGKQEDVLHDEASNHYNDLWSFNTATNKFIKLANYTNFYKNNYKGGYRFFRKDSLLYYFCIKSSDESPVMLVSKITDSKLTEYPILIPKLSDDKNRRHDFKLAHYNKKNNKVYLLSQISAYKYVLLSANFPPIYKKQNLSAEAPPAINIFWDKNLIIISVIVFIAIGYIAVKRIRKNNSEKEYKVFKIPKTVPQKDAIFLFGELSILNETGKDILNKFTNQAEQLFLLILLHSIPNKKGIAGDIIDELYYGVNSTSAISNKRSVGINRLRNYLKSYPELKIETNETIFSLSLKDFSIIDLFRLQHYIDLENEELINNKDVLNDFCFILERGAFLLHLDYGWLDSFKQQINEDIINKLTALIDLLKTKLFKNSNEHFSLIYRLASIITIHDPLNEQALKIRIKHLKLKGSFGLAEKIYRNFTAEYKNTYGENYNIPFAEIIENGEKHE